MKKVLVTGGAGFIGSHLVDELVSRGVEVEIIDDLSTGSLENVNEKAGIQVCKIEDVDGGWEGYDVVFHLAARARIQPSIKDPLATDIANVHGTVAALEIARACGAHFILSSSSSIYGCDEKIALAEDRTPNPLNPYALTKWIDEQYVHLYEHLYGLKATVFRYFNVFGERQLVDGPYSTVVGIFKNQHEKGEPFTIVGDGEQRRDFTYVKDVVAANILAAEKPFTGTYNVGTGKNVSVNEIADAIGGKDYHREMGIKRAGEVRETRANNGRLLAQGWKPTMDVLTWLKS